MVKWGIPSLKAPNTLHISSQPQKFKRQFPYFLRISNTETNRKHDLPSCFFNEYKQGIYILYIYMCVCAWNLDRILTATTRTPVSWYFMCRVARLTWISSEWDTRTVPHTSRFQHCITLARFGKATVGQQPRISKPMLCQAGCHTSSGSLPGRAAASTKSWAKASAAVVAWGVASPQNVPVISCAMLYSLAD